MLVRTWKTGEATSTLGLSHEVLLELRASHKDGEEFIRALHQRGVNSKPLQEKLKCLVPVNPKR